MSGPPPPPPPPGHVRPMGPNPQAGGGSRIPLPPPPPPGARGGQGFQPMPIRQPIQQSSRIVDITPAKMMDEAACLKKLTTYAAFTIRKVPSHDPRKDTGTWARAEIVEERVDQSDIIKQIKKLNERGRSITEKKAALKPNQQGQITTLLDDLATKEHDRAFDWTLIQLNTTEKPVSLKNQKKKSLYETTTMTAYVRRAPFKDLNAVMLYQNIERMKAESMRPPQQQQQQQQHQQPHPPPQQQHQPPPPPPPPHPQQQQQHQQQNGNKMSGGRGGPGPQIVKQRSISKMRSNSKMRANSRSRIPKATDKKRGAKRYNDSSSGSELDSESDSGSNSDSSSSSSSATSLNSSLDHTRKGRRNSRGPMRGHSRHRTPQRISYLNDRHRSRSPNRRFDSSAYGYPAQRPYVPEVPRVDPIASAYHAGKADARAETFGLDRLALRAEVPRVIQAIDPIAAAYHAGTEDNRAETLTLNRLALRPEAPRVIQTIDPIAAAYQAGKQDNRAERYGLADHLPIRPVVDQPREIIAYGRRERLYSAPSVPSSVDYRHEERYHDDRYHDEFRHDEIRHDDYFGRERDVEDYIERRPIGDTRPGPYNRPLPRPIERRESYHERRDFDDRRPSPPRSPFTKSNPFAPQSLPRRYPPPSSTSGYESRGW